MQNNWKTFAPVAVVVLLVGVAVVGMSGKEGVDEGASLAVREVTLPVAPDLPMQEDANTRMMMTAKNTPESSASGNIDDIMAELDREADAESTVLADTDDDALLVSSDSQVISDYAQAYDETSF